MVAATHRLLLSDKRIANWHTELSQGSVATADKFLRMLGLACQRMDTTPQGLLDLHAAQIEAIEAARASRRPQSEWPLDDRVRGFITNPENKNVRTVFKAIKSWLVFALHDAQPFAGAFKFPKAARTQRRRMFTPTPEQLRKVLNASDPRQKAAISVLAFGGQRLEVLGNYTGTALAVLSRPQKADAPRSSRFPTRNGAAKAAFENSRFVATTKAPPAMATIMT